MVPRCKADVFARDTVVPAVVASSVTLMVRLVLSVALLASTAVVLVVGWAV